VTSYGYGSLDRLALVRADALGLDRATCCVHDPAGSRTCLIHPASHPCHLSHDLLGRLASERAPTAKIEMADAAASATQAATYVFSRRLAPWFSGAPLVASGRDGRRTQAILDAMYRSAYDEDGGWVTVAPEL
jgi:hypothetical protein